MAGYRKSPEAEADLIKIWRWIAEQSQDRGTATRFIDKLHGTMGLLADVPGMGRQRPDLAPNLRGFPVGRYLIFYREISSGVEIVRVLTGERDLKQIFTDQ